MSLVVTQGMASNHVVSQGWSPLVPSTGLVLEGLGSPRFLVQGLSGSFATWSFLPAGGLGVGGSKGPGVALQGMASGGLFRGAKSPMSFSCMASALGGVRAGGAPLWAARTTALIVAEGGIGRGGNAVAGLGAVVIASGGSILGGAGPGAAAIVFAASGGIAIGGFTSDRPFIYHVYINSGAGDPVRYAFPVAALSKTSWTSQPLNAPGRYKLAVRCLDLMTGLEEQNVDAVVDLVLDPNGIDITRVPRAPFGLRAFAVAGGKIRVEWTCFGDDPARTPLGFHAYVGVGDTPDYTQPVATVPWSNNRLGGYSAELVGLPGGPQYAIGVRAFNAVTEETNVQVMTVVIDANPPTLVESLSAVATNLEA